MKAGAEEALTPSDVISAADITFSCVSDPQVAKDVSAARPVKSDGPSQLCLFQ